MLNRSIHDKLSLAVVVPALVAGLIGGLIAGRLSLDPWLPSRPRWSRRRRSSLWTAEERRAPR